MSTTETTDKEDDPSYKRLFSAPELVRDLIMGFIADDWLHSLDFTTLEKQPSSYVTDDYRHRHDDVVWRVKADGEWLYLYILLEFQSEVDHFMAVRVMVYLGLLYQDLIRRHEILPGHKLPPVLPIVLYNGDKTWHAATNIADLIPKVPGLVLDYLPSLKYLLIAEKDYQNQDLKSLKNLMAAVIGFEYPLNTQALLDWIDDLNLWLADNPELRRIFAGWIRALLLRRSHHHLVIPKVNDLKELKMGLAERIESWEREFIEHGRQEGKQEGKQEGLLAGKKEGESLILQRQLTKRFGPLPADKIALIAAASTEQLEIWLDRVLDAEALEDIFS